MGAFSLPADSGLNEAETYRVRVSAAVSRAPGELLIVRERKRALTVLNLPGGTPRMGETLQAAAVREVREETGYDVITSEIAFVAERRTERWGGAYLEVCFYAQITNQAVHPQMRHDGIFAVEWLPFEHSDVRLHLPHADMLEASMRGRFLAESRENAP